MNKYQKFEVYTHSNIHTGTPFYVGSGVVGRAKETKNRNLDWGKEIDLLGGAYDVNIIATYDNIEEARTHEDKLIRFFGLRKHGGVLTNQRYFTKGGPTGYKWTEEQRERQSEIWQNEDLRRRQSEAMTKVWQDADLRKRRSEIMAKIAAEVQNRPETRLKKGRGGVVVKDLLTGESTIYISTKDAQDKLNALGIKCNYATVHNYCVLNDNTSPDGIVSPKRYPQLSFFYHDRWREVFEVDKQQETTEE